MSYHCQQPELWEGQVVGDGQCVAYVKECSGAPQTALWQRGTGVRGSPTLSRGTAIATFDATGRYPSHATGNHAAIYLSQSEDGIWVYDQWTSHGSHHPVSKRLIRFKGGVGSPSNDGDAYSVIE